MLPCTLLLLTTIFAAQTEAALPKPKACVSARKTPKCFIEGGGVVTSLNEEIINPMISILDKDEYSRLFLDDNVGRLVQSIVSTAKIDDKFTVVTFPMQPLNFEDVTLLNTDSKCYSLTLCKSLSGHLGDFNDRVKYCRSFPTHSNNPCKVINAAYAIVYLESDEQVPFPREWNNVSHQSLHQGKMLVALRLAAIIIKYDGKADDYTGIYKSIVNRLKSALEGRIDRQ